MYTVDELDRDCPTRSTMKTHPSDCVVPVLVESAVRTSIGSHAGPDTSGLLIIENARQSASLSVMAKLHGLLELDPGQLSDDPPPEPLLHTPGREYSRCLTLRQTSRTVRSWPSRPVSNSVSPAGRMAR
nr:hypothetical protein CFP56_21661 [Quercus suber]